MYPPIIKVLQMDRIYLDHSATTPLASAVLEAMLPYMSSHFGNASSIHSFGRDAKVAVDEARDKIVAALHAAPQEIIFTSGGTEANNLAIFGIARTFDSPRHLITSRIEHPSVLSAVRQLEKRGWNVSYVSADTDGIVSVEAVMKAIRPETVLISIMHANNETGAINPIEDLARLASERKIPLHVDAVQTFGKLEIDSRKIPFTLLSLSGHKIYGPKGCGVLFVRRGLKIDPLLLGGKQERGRRAGTENVAAIVGLGKAAEMRTPQLAEEHARLRLLSESLYSGIQQCYPRATLNGHPEKRLPGVLNLSFPGFDSLSLVMSLDLHGVAVSNGSACSSGSVEPSHVLRAMNLSPERANSAIRFSLGKDTTEAEIVATLEALEKILQRKKRAPQPRETLVPA